MANFTQRPAVYEIDDEGAGKFKGEASVGPDGKVMVTIHEAGRLGGWNIRLSKEFNSVGQAQPRVEIVLEELNNMLAAVQSRFQAL